MINDDITRQIAADYARLLTSTTEGFDLTLAEAIDYDVLPEDVLAQLCELLLTESWEEELTAANKRAKKLHSTPDPTFNDRMQASATPSQPKNSSDLPSPKRPTRQPDGGMSMGVENKNSLLSRFQNIFNKRREQGVHGAAAQSSALKPLNRRVIASQAKLGDAAGQETIRRDINKTGLKDKLRAAGIDTKVRVRVDKTTGHYHVTDKTGKTHVIESKV